MARNSGCRSSGPRISRSLLYRSCTPSLARSFFSGSCDLGRRGLQLDPEQRRKIGAVDHPCGPWLRPRGAGPRRRRRRRARYGRRPEARRTARAFLPDELRRRRAWRRRACTSPPSPGTSTGMRSRSARPARPAGPRSRSSRAAFRDPRWRIAARRTLAPRRARSSRHPAEASPALRHLAETRRAHRRVRSASRSAREMARGRIPWAHRDKRGLAGIARSRTPASMPARPPPAFQPEPCGRGSHSGCASWRAHHLRYGRNLPCMVTFTRSPFGSGTVSTYISKSMALMMPSPSFS